MHTVSQQQNAKKLEDDAFYVFAASSTEDLDTLELRINDKLANVMLIQVPAVILCHKMYFNL